jgi:flagellar motor switch protein FliG
VKPDENRLRWPLYSFKFTPIHHRALRYLEAWEENDIQSQVDKLLEEVPWSKDEAEALSRLERESEARLNE